MSTTTTPVSRKRCPLCLAILEITHVAGGTISTAKISVHTPESCRESTLQRIKVLEELHQRDSRDLEQQAAVVNQLGMMIGALSSVVSAGRRWLEHRKKRAEDVARLRSAFGTQERIAQHPLWSSEEDVAAAVQRTIEEVEKWSGS